MILLYFFNLVFASQTATICYLSLNNEKEFTVTQSHFDKLTKKTGKEIRVLEFQNPDVTMNPEESFKRMVESGAPCDGLVISGHHYGSFGGKQANGQLSISFIEKLSCDPKYKDFFENIKSLWLQGCRTLGVGSQETISAYDANADFHTNRVGQVLTEDHLEASFADLNMEFSATLDQDNPLSSRYLRVFPRATVFGWTKSAPGERAGSQYSILYHTAHIAALNDDRAAVFKSPDSMSDAEAMKYVNSVLNLFKPEKGDKCEFQNIEAWLRHGRVKDSTTPGFNNPDLQAYPALQAQDNPKLHVAKDLACILETSQDNEEILKTLDIILSDRETIAFNFNNIWELVQRLEKQKSPFLNAVTNKLKSSEKLNEFLSAKITSETLGIVRKIDYYAFYRSVSGNSSANIENKIIEAAGKILNKDSANYDELDFQITLVQSLAKNELLKNQRGFSLLSAVAKNKNENLRAALAVQAPNLGEYTVPMLDLLKTDSSARVRGEVASAVYFVGERGEAIISLLKKDSNENVRWQMVEALQRHPDKKRAAELLKDFASDKSVMIREVVVDSAKALNQTNIILELVNDPNGIVSDRARKALGVQTPGRPSLLGN